MKFAHTFEEALKEDGLPPSWVESAIPYRQLKKCIRKVEGELRSLGLGSETLGQLIPSHPDQEDQQACLGSREVPVAFLYNFADDCKPCYPKLTLIIQIEDGVVIDTCLSSDTRAYLEMLASRQRLLQLPHTSQLKNDSSDTTELTIHHRHSISQVIAGSTAALEQETLVIQQVELPLTFDSEFFGLLQSNVIILDNLQAKEQKAMVDEIVTLGKEIAKVTSPLKCSKTDLCQWQELFDIYLHAGIFFSTSELDHGSRNSTLALAQLQWFQKEVTKRGLIKSFKLSTSRDVLDRFMRINVNLLYNLNFQEINQLAIAKILKKFDKRTSLPAKNKFLNLIKPALIMSDAMSRAVCATVSNQIIRIVPQLDDYLCPVCFSISYKPVRLTCGHVFCIRCMIQMQRARTKHCPLCRNDAIMDADSANLDIALMNFMQMYFPKESKVKQKENEIAAGVDRYGEDYANVKCIVM